MERYPHALIARPIVARPTASTTGHSQTALQRLAARPRPRPRPRPCAPLCRHVQVDDLF